MKILITGANGMLGMDLCPILEKKGYSVIKTDIHNLDITDSNSCSFFFTKEIPDLVIHCAAYTNVDKAEEDFSSAEKINSQGTENIAKICAKNDIALVYISTDYVFDGNKLEPYTPIDSTNPINNYGKTKLFGEEKVKKYCKKYYIIRTSWLYGKYGKNFIETMISLRNKNELTIINDQVGCPTWTIELAQGIIEIFNKYPYGTYHICGDGETSWYNFAKEIFSNLNTPIKLIPCSSENYPSKAKRPKYSVMKSDIPCKNWKLALKEYLALR